MYKFIAVFLLALPAFGQSYSGQSAGDVRVVPPYKWCLGPDNGQDACFIQGAANNAQLRGSLDFAFTAKTVATLPAASANSGRAYYVSDGTSTTDCSVGHGSTKVLCLSDGTSWNNLAGGGSSLPTAASQGQIPVATGPGTTYAAQTKAVIDVRDSGIDCTGATDSSSALNTLFGSISGKEVDIPYNCQIRAVSQLVIQGQTSFRIVGKGTRSVLNGLSGPIIFGCNPAGSGPLLYINRSGYGVIEGISIVPKGNSPCNTSTFTQSIQVDSTGNPGVTTHNIIFDNLGLSTSPAGGTISGYTGISITDGGKQNGEMIRIRNSWISCQNSTSSIGIDLENGTSDKDVFESNNISLCFIGIKHQGGNATIRDNLLTSNGNFSVFGDGGGNIWIGGCASGPINITGNEEDTGGQFINTNNDNNASSCLAGENIVGNYLGIADYNTAKYPVNVFSGVNFFVGNQIALVQNPTTTIVGSASQGSSGPVGTIYEWGNTLQNTHGNVFGVCCQSPSYQQGEFHFGFSGVGGVTNSTNRGTMDMMYFSNIYLGGWASPMTVWRNSYNGAASDDWALQSIASGATNSSFLIKHQQGSTNGFMGFDGTLSGLTIGQIGTPATPTVGPVGGTGATTYTYAVVAYTPDGGTVAGSTTTINNGVAFASLSSTVYNQVSWTPDPGATKYCVWRTAGGTTQGNIGCTSALLTTANTGQYGYTPNGLSGAGPDYFLKDTGLAGDSSSLPGSNTTGKLVSTVPTGTAPLNVSSTTQVPNLNVSQLEGGTWEVPGTIGSTTPNSGAFTTVSTNGANGGLWATEGNCSGVTSGAGIDALCPNSTAHRWQMSNNNGSFTSIAGFADNLGNFASGGTISPAQINISNILCNSTAPTISSGFGTSPSVANNNGNCAFTINVGTGGTANSGVIGLPTASHGWAVHCTDITTTSSTVFMTKQTATTTTTATVGNFNTSAAAAAWVASDILSCTASAY